MTNFFLKDEAATLALGAQYASQWPPKKAMLIFLHGDLGAGKTTFVRGFLRALGFEGLVKSPTFTLVEEYHLDDQKVFHFDLYRLKDASELEHMGLSDYLSQDAIILLEWPEKGVDYFPKPNVELFFNLEGEGRACVIRGSVA